MGVSNELYYIGDGFPNEAYCLNKRNDEIEVYYSERGKREGRNIFYQKMKRVNIFLKKFVLMQWNVNENGLNSWRSPNIKCTLQYLGIRFSGHLALEGQFIKFEITELCLKKVPSSIMRKFIYKSGRTQSAQGRETCP